MTISDPHHLPGHDVIAGDGHKAGNVETVLYDADTDEPVVVVVATGLLGRKVTMVPLVGASRDDKGRLLVPYERDRIHDAPHHDPEVDLSAADEAALFAYYDLPYPGGHGATHPGAWGTRPYVTKLPPTLS